AIEEVGGVAGIRGARGEAGEGSKGAGGPLPSVGEKSFDAEGARGVGERVYGCGIPLREIEVAVPQGGLLFAPWIAAFRITRRAVGRAVPLGFRRKTGADPLRVGRGFGMADVNRPIGRKR